MAAVLVRGRGRALWIARRLRRSVHGRIRGGRPQTRESVCLKVFMVFLTRVWEIRTP